MPLAHRIVHVGRARALVRQILGENETLEERAHDLEEELDDDEAREDIDGREDEAQHLRGAQ
tara:strand:+ start:233 stop:418 length:186 start_codon:yes stop_codon:yes gene_type:complete|eukprot:scaffold70920_cov69-Phaeocystis_antarctica.AAC.1